MGSQKSDKLNQLQRLLPAGLIADAAWLRAHGYSRQLVAKYAKSGWLESPARGAYRRPGPPLKWQHVVLSLQHLFGLAIAVGGRTALELHGLAHYLPLASGAEIQLHGRDRLPGWVAQLPLAERFSFHGDTLFAAGAGSRQPGLTALRWGEWDRAITLSTPERAMLEFLQAVPARETFHHADMLMQGLASLSPRRVSLLLAQCRNVKVKRLFLWLAERHRHAWFDRLDLAQVDLGKGKRSLVPGGRLDAKYGITVPAELAHDAG